MAHFRLRALHRRAEWQDMALQPIYHRTATFTLTHEHRRTVLYTTFFVRFPKSMDSSQPLNFRTAGHLLLVRASDLFFFRTLHFALLLCLWTLVFGHLTLLSDCTLHGLSLSRTSGHYGLTSDMYHQHSHFVALPARTLSRNLHTD